MPALSAGWQATLSGGFRFSKVGIETRSSSKQRCFVAIVFKSCLLLERRSIPVQSAKHVRGRQCSVAIAKACCFINQAGVMYIIFASSLLHAAFVALRVGASALGPNRTEVIQRLLRAALTALQGMFSQGNSFVTTCCMSA